MNPDSPTPSDPTALRTAPAPTPVGEVYAKALIELALEQDKLDPVAEQAAQLQELVQTDADLHRLITHPILSREQLAGVLERVFEGRLDPLLYNFIQTVNRKDRLSALPSILQSFARRLAEHRNQITVETHVARPLDDATADRVARGLGESLDKQVTLDQRVDPSLIGGLRLRIGDRLLDASVARQLRVIEQQLITVGRERARAAGFAAAGAGAEGPRGQGAE
jgi:ATP synthase F1 delta subunit